jgi:LTXXQ motif family protein
MLSISRITLSAIVLATSVAAAQAQTAPDQDHAAHHPQGQVTEQARPPVMPMGQAGNGSAMMGGDMAQMRAMMQMMRGGMMPMGMGMAGGRPFQHIEGQIAFYKTELKITDAQEPLWNAFADALRANASHLQQAMAKATEAKGVVAVPEQMERRIAMLTVLLDAMQSMQTAAKPLYAALSDDQKKVADELMAEHMMAMRARGL